MKWWPNRYARACASCRRQVPASIFDGDKCVQRMGSVARTEIVDTTTGEVKANWITYCLLCSNVVPTNERVPSPVAHVAVTRTGNDIEVRVVGWLGADEYANYKEACANSDLIITAGADLESVNRGPASAAAGVIAALKDGGFQLDVAPEVVADLQAQAAVARHAGVAATQRIATLRDALAKRGRALRPYQEDGITFLSTRTAALLADDMGLGKSAQVLLALAEETRPVIVAPASVLGNWKLEVQRWRPDLPVSTVIGTTRKKGGTCGFRNWPDTDRVLLVSYESLGDDLPAGDVPPNMVLVADEAHRLKARTTLTRVAVRFRAISARVKKAGGRVWLLTGTPLMNEIGELWQVLEAAGLGADLFGSSRKFKRIYARDPDRLAQTLKRGMLRRTKAEVLADLPPKLYDERLVSISDADRQQLDAILGEIIELAVAKAMAKAVEEGKDPLASASKARASVTAAIDLAFNGDGAIPFELISRVKSLLALAKTPAALEILDEWELTPEPTLFFSSNLAPVAEVGKRTGWVTLTGATPTNDRDELVAAFQAGACRGMALTIRAGGVGINLTRAQRELFSDLEWTPGLNDQAIDRAHRPGQAHTIYILQLVADHPLDRRIAELLSAKRLEVAMTVDRAVYGASERPPDRATEIEAVLTGLDALRPPTAEAPVMKEYRGPQTPEEMKAAAYVHAKLAPTGHQLFDDLAGTFRKKQVLTGRQWEVMTSIVHRLASRPPADASEERIAAMLRILTPAMSRDQETVAKLRTQLGATGELYGSGWQQAAWLVQKYGGTA